MIRLHRPFVRTFVVVYFALCSWPLIACGESSTSSGPLPSVESLRIGFDNTYKLGCWTPVEVKLSGASGDSGASGQIEIQAPDNDGVPTRYLGDKIVWTMGQTCRTYVRIGRPDARVEVLLRKNGGADSSESLQLSLPAQSAGRRALPGTNELVLEIGTSMGLPELFKRKDQSDAERTTVVTLDSAQLPDHWYGYEGVDLIAIAAAPAIQKSLLKSETIDALQRWVEMGGTLLVACGSHFEQLLGPGAPLARFAPGEYLQTVQRNPFGIIESYAGTEAHERIDSDPSSPSTIPLAEWRNIRGRIDSFDQIKSVPLVVRWPLGFGRVIFVGLDLHAEPFNRWFDRPAFLEKILSGPDSAPAKSTKLNTSAHATQLGFIDLSGQLRTALDQFDGVRLVPLWAIALLAIGYIGVLFPVNYLIAIRWLNQPWIAWLVFPIAVIAISAAAFAWMYESKGRQLRVNQLDLVDVDIAAGRSRGATWFDLYCPANQTHDLHLAPNPIVTKAEDATKSDPTILSWFGLSGSGLGGMSSRAESFPLFDTPYTINPTRDRITAVPFSAWSSKSFIARWSERESGLEASLTPTADRRLQGTITSALRFPITGGKLLFDRWVYSLGALPPGETVRLDKLEPKDKDTYLLQRPDLAMKQDFPPYDRTSFDTTRLVEVMMFHELAGGSNYTGLLNRQQQFVDLSDQLALGRAVLVASGPAGAELWIDGRPASSAELARHETFYRFVLPVARSASEATP